MPFHSPAYFLFLPAVLLLQGLAPGRFRWAVLLAASLLFYAALEEPHLLAALLVVAAVTHAVGLRMGRAAGEGEKRSLLRAGVAANVLVLAAVKYLPALSEGAAALLGLLHVDVPVPRIGPFAAIGVSYFVFQAISYLVDIHLEAGEPEPSFGRFLLFLAFFPKLLQGPIERGHSLLPQLREPYSFDGANARAGLLLFAWGLFKKAVVADRLGIYVDTVYGDVHAFGGPSLLLATYAYALQIYMDFSGYTDMALGSGRLFNVRLAQNFDGPYLATSVADFWRRWHISFSRWILDYIFRPLQMRWRDGRNAGTAAALLVTFLVSGVWHGATWGFVLWGGLHGLFLAASVYWKPYQKRIHRALRLERTALLRAWQTFVTFHLVCLAWVFFRAATVSDAFYVLSHLVAPAKGLGKLLLAQDRTGLVLAASFLGGAIALEGIHRVRPVDRILLATPLPLRWCAYLLLLVVILLFNVDGGASFAYFRF